MSDETGGALAYVLSGLGLTSTALGAWILRTSTRQERIEQQVADLKEHTDERLDKLERGIGKIGKHVTGADLW